MTKLMRSQMPVMRPLPMKKTDNLRRWQILEAYELPYRGGRLHIPKMFIFDGASIPALFRGVYNPTGYLFLAGLFHDFCYRHGFYIYRPFPKSDGVENVLTQVEVDQKKADELFLDIANTYYKEHKIKTWVAYKSLRVGGFVAWNRYRKL